MAYVQETHSDDERDNGVPWVHDKPGCNSTVTRFFLEKLDVEAEEYRKRNAKGGQKYVVHTQYVHPDFQKTCCMPA
jgi:hypothetical protein